MSTTTLTDKQKDEFLVFIRKRLLTCNGAIYMVRLRACRSLFLKLNSELRKGTLFGNDADLDVLFTSAHRQASRILKELDDQENTRGYKDYAALVQTTLRISIYLYRSTIKLWYSCSLNKVPLDVNHIIIGYLCGS